MDNALSAVVLAGGKSSRFGSDKASALLHGQPMLVWVVRAVSLVAAPIVVVKARGQALPALGSLNVALEVVDDFVEARGPLAGLVAGLRVSQRPLVIATSCDTPLLQPRLIAALAAMIDRYDAVVPRTGGLLHPLAAVYRLSTCLPVFERALSNGDLRLTAALRPLDVRVVEEAALRELDRDLGTFMNANDPAALESIASLLRERE